MEAITEKDYLGEKSHLIALVWEDDEEVLYIIRGIPSYTRRVWNIEGPIREAFNKSYRERLDKLLWGK